MENYEKSNHAVEIWQTQKLANEKGRYKNEGV